MNEIEKATVLARCSDYLASQGITVMALDNFERVSELLAEAGKPYLTPFSSPIHNDLTEGNALWLIGLRDGRPVMMGCARLEDIGREPIESYWRRAFARAYAGQGAGSLHSVNPEITKWVSGRLVYFGDLFIEQGTRGMRSNLRCFTAVGHMAVSLKWDPDYTYAFIRERDLLRGSGHAYGFNWFVPDPFVWPNPPHPRSPTEWGAFISRGDLPYVARKSLEAIQTIKEA